RHDLTISTLSGIVAEGPDAGPLAAETKPAVAGASAATPARVEWTTSQRMLRAMAKTVSRLVTRMDIDGADRLPREGAVVVAVNHLHILDALWAFVVIPRRAVFLVANEFRNRPVVGSLLRVGDSIFVERGAGDYQAARRAIDVLRGGAAVGIAPEG